MRTTRRLPVVALAAAGLPVLPALVTLLLLVAAAARAAEAPNCTTAQCHGPLVSKKTVHPAADDCTTCHQSTGEAHPQKGKKTFKLTDAEPALCTTCHDAPGQKKVVHPPAKEGCTTCHDPHSSDQPKLLADTQSGLCGTCHSEKTEAAFLHGPVSAGDCTACHNPHESDNKKLLVADGDKVCFSCHGDLEKMLQKKDVHPAVEAGCTSCHDPHGNKHRYMFAEEVPALCFTCHSDIGDTVEKATTPHKPVQSEKACITCHSPHASDNDKLLLASERDTCTGCHKDILNKRMTTLHGPIKEGHCTACHNPHGGQNPRLLAKPFPATPYVAYGDQEYALCFSCHNPDLAKFPDTSFATNFRDGDRNLHFVHVNDKVKGRSCRMCHDLHGADNEKLIATSVRFGTWDLPLHYVKTENGGGCSPGCHRPYSYDRKSPGHITTPAKPAPPPAAAPAKAPAAATGAPAAPAKGSTPAAAVKPPGR
jgi:predicted CXXCH cytochrome family protein